MVSIPIEPEDDELYELVWKSGYRIIRMVRKNEPYNFAPLVRDMTKGDFVIRITADNPLLDPSLVKKLVVSFPSVTFGASGIATRSDFYPYDTQGFPWGMDAEVFYVSALRASFIDKMYKSSKVRIMQPAVQCAPGLNLTVDWPHDLLWIYSVEQSFREHAISLTYENIAKWWNERGRDGLLSEVNRDQ